MDNIVEMNSYQRFQDEGYKNWIKTTMALDCLRKCLENFLEDETETYHQTLREKIDLQEQECSKKCSFENWDPRSSQIPPLGCDVCVRWRDEILANHTSKGGKVLWRNSKPYLWPNNKWEVAKVYMPNGHKDHKSAGDFDIPALLLLMTQCQYFKKYVQESVCTEVNSVRNQVMHSPNFEVKREDLHKHLKRIKKLANVLEKQSETFRGLSQELDKLQNLDFSLMFHDSTERESFLNRELQILKEKMACLSQQAEEDRKNMLSLEELHDMEVFLEENRDLQTELSSQFRMLSEMQEQQGQQIDLLNKRVEELEKRSHTPEPEVNTVPMFKNHLFELARTNNWSLPVFSEIRENAGFQGQVTIQGKTFTGSQVHRSKIQAHQEVAKIALKDLAIATANNNADCVDPLSQSECVSQAASSFFGSVTFDLDTEVLPDQRGSATEEAMESVYKKLVRLFGLDPPSSDSSSKEAVLQFCQRCDSPPPEEISGARGLKLIGKITFYDSEGSTKKKQAQKQAAKAALQGLRGVLQEPKVFNENYVGALKELLEASRLGQPSYDVTQILKKGVTWVGNRRTAGEAGRGAEGGEVTQRNKEGREQEHVVDELPETDKGAGDAEGSHQLTVNPMIPNHLLHADTSTSQTHLMPTKPRERNISGDRRQFVGSVKVTTQKDLGPFEASSQEGAVQAAYRSLLTDLCLGPAAEGAGEKQSVLEFFTQKKCLPPSEDIVATIDGRFRCTLKINGALTFCSPVVTSKKQEAENLAAKEALKHLEGLLSTAGENHKGRLQELLAKNGIEISLAYTCHADRRQFVGSVKVTIQKDLGPFEASSQEGAVQAAYRSLLTDLCLGPAAEGAGQKQSVLEFFTQKKCPPPSEDIVATIDGRFRCTLKINGELAFCSPEGAPKKKEAEQLAAKEAVKHLEGLLSAAGEKNYKGRLQELLAKLGTADLPEYWSTQPQL